MSHLKDFEVVVPYSLTGHVSVSVEATSAKAAQAKAIAMVKAGDYDEDIGINMGGSTIQIDESQVEVG